MDKEASDEQQINSPDQIAKIQKEMENKLSSSYVNLNENKKSMLYYNTTRETKNDNVINNLFDDNKFNRENLEYINTLLKAKEVEKEKSPLPINQYNIKISSSNINMNNLNGSNHKKSSNSVDQPIAERSKPLTEKFNNSVDNPTSKNWNPFAKKTIKEEKNENDSSQKQTQNPEVNELKEKGQENSTKRERIKSLFEQNNKKFAETNEKKNVNNSVSHHQRDSSYSFRTNKKEEGSKICLFF